MTVPTTAVALASASLALIWLLVRHFGATATAEQVLATSRFFSALALVLIGLAGVPALAVSRLAALTRSIRLVRTLDPLWRRVRELHPAVALPISEVPRWPTLRVQRMLIEVSDALQLILLPSSFGDPVRSIAAVLADPTGDEVGRPASTLLPTPGSFRQEAEILVSLAVAYSRIVAGNAPRGLVASPGRDIGGQA